MKRNGPQPKPVSRRAMLKGTATLMATAGIASVSGCANAPSRVDRNYRVQGEAIQQSVAYWCYTSEPNPITVEKLAHQAKHLGLKSVELVPPEHYSTLNELGLVCAIAGIDMSPDPPFVKGFNNPAFHSRVIEATRNSIDNCAACGFPSVISFSGYRAIDPDDPNSAHITREDGIRNCIEGYKKIVGHAEKKGVTLQLEMLNTRDDTHPMKGHPGYQADDLEYCIEVIDKVGSPNLKLLFDVYHVQVMQGDVIRRLRVYKDYIGHYHTAGNPGRAELDENQEVNYRPVMHAIAETGYQGYVGQEFIPTWDNKLAALAHAVKLCDI